MAWQLTEDLDTYLAAAGGFLRSNAAGNTILLNAAQTLQVSGMAAFGDATPLFGWRAEPDGPVDAAFLHTPPFPVVLTTMTTAAAAALAAALADRGRRPSGVNATTGPGAAFAAAWQQHTGQAAYVGLRSRLYGLGRLLPPDPPPAGRARTASAVDRDLLLAWLDAFHDEALPTGPDESARVVDNRLSFGGLTFWEHAGEPVSLAGRTRPAAGQVRLGPVYTPPQLRKRGYAAGVTAAVTRAALDDGADGVVLFTDLANPTSNTLYQRLGFRPLADWAVHVFSDP